MLWVSPTQIAEPNNYAFFTQCAKALTTNKLWDNLQLNICKIFADLCLSENLTFEAFLKCGFWKNKKTTKKPRYFSSMVFKAGCFVFLEAKV